MSVNSFDAKQTLQVGSESYQIFRLDAVDGSDQLPYSLKILLENLLRTEDGANITADHIRTLASWDPTAEPSEEIQFTPARVIMQDFTGVPCVVDLATMREAMADLGGDATKINPLAPAELVVDHSVIADVFGTADAFERNVQIEYGRNRERYQFLRWGQTAFDDFKVVPPGTGIVHQVNIEHLARVVFSREIEDASADAGRVVLAYPDTCVGTDSHTTMVNGLGVVGWGVGGIEAEAAMLGQPVSMLIPRVVGFKLSGSLPEGATATDLVLTITEMLRKHKVVGKFVEFYGPGVSHVPLANRATIGNMSPEYGSTIAVFPIDAKTTDYLRLTGRTEEQIALVETYAREQGLWHEDDREPKYSEYLELDLGSVVPSIAGPKRPQDRVILAHAKGGFREALDDYVEESDAPDLPGYDEAVVESFPASDAPSHASDDHETDPHEYGEHGGGIGRPSRRTPVTLSDGSSFEIDHGAVVIAAITSCTNTSNPSVMIGAALVAKKAVERGLSRKPWVKTTLAPGSKVVSDYYERSGLTPYLDKLGFNLVGYGCTTCIGNSGPLIPEVSAAVQENDLAVVSVLSGNRNFEGRINPDVKANFLMSPPLVVAFALAGRVHIDLSRDPLGRDKDGKETFLRDLWPTLSEIQDTMQRALTPETFRKFYRDFAAQNPKWNEIPSSTGDIYQWDEKSDYIHDPPFFENFSMEPGHIAEIRSAHALGIFGDTVTTDHISPAGAIKESSPAGKYLMSRGIQPRDFNSYGSRRGNDLVMTRGTFANVRIKNLMLPGIEGGYTIYFGDEEVPAPDKEMSTDKGGKPTFIYDACMAYKKANTPLIIIT